MFCSIGLPKKGTIASGKGENLSGVSKESLCGLINGRMIDGGIAHRKNDNIREKIKSLEASFKRATDWRANTDQGVTNEGDLNSAMVGSTTD